MTTMYPPRLHFGFVGRRGRPVVEGTPRLDVATVVGTLRKIAARELCGLTSTTRHPAFVAMRTPEDAGIVLVLVGDVPHVARLTSIEAPLGGRRWFAVCPRCERRVLSLYVLDQNVACRTCHGLAYASQRHDAHWRAFFVCEALEMRLGRGDGPPDMDSLGGLIPRHKPVRMHWRTYGRLWAQYRLAATAFADGWSGRGIDASTCSVHAWPWP